MYVSAEFKQRKNVWKYWAGEFHFWSLCQHKMTTAKPDLLCPSHKGISKTEDPLRSEFHWLILSHMIILEMAQEGWNFLIGLDLGYNPIS